MGWTAEPTGIFEQTAPGRTSVFHLVDMVRYGKSQGRQGQKKKLRLRELITSQIRSWIFFLKKIGQAMGGSDCGYRLEGLERLESDPSLG